MSRLNTLGALTSATLAVIAASGACTAPPSATDLNPAGPPMIRQILVNEEYTDTAGDIRTRPQPQLAYGHNDDPAFADDDGMVVSAVATPGGQTIRVVMDELLVGNNLEMVQCRGPVNTSTGLDKTFSRVPVGATPDDLANCSGAQDLVTARCVGDHTVCINNTGTTVITDQGGAAVPPGAAVGIEDKIPAPDGDGVPDADLFIQGSVRVMCKGVQHNLVEAPIDIVASYWDPSGNQQVPAHGGVSALGPAVVLKTTLGLPTSSTCHIVFDPSVTDTQGNPVCAPPGGNVDQDCPSVGDTTLATFGVAALRLDSKGNNPADGDSGVPTTQVISFQFNTTMDEATLAANITLTANGVNVPFTLQPTAGTLGFTMVTGPLSPNSTYVLTFGPGITDFAGQPLGKTITRTFMTGA